MHACDSQEWSREWLDKHKTGLKKHLHFIIQNNWYNKIKWNNMTSYWKYHCSYTTPWFTVTISPSLHAPTTPSVACKFHSLNQFYHTPCRVPISLLESILPHPVSCANTTLWMDHITSCAAPIPLRECTLERNLEPTRILNVTLDVPEPWM